jgi:hypothetical protein
MRITVQWERPKTCDDDIASESAMRAKLQKTEAEWDQRPRIAGDKWQVTAHATQAWPAATAPPDLVW